MYPPTRASTSAPAALAEPAVDEAAELGLIVGEESAPPTPLVAEDGTLKVAVLTAVVETAEAVLQGSDVSDEFAKLLVEVYSRLSVLNGKE